jgi:transketolase
MNKIPNRQIICDELMELASADSGIVVICSDSRGSASLTAFAEAFPKQFIDAGIAEQSLVSVAAGLAKCGKKPLAASPASFLSTRAFEQCKVDVAYSGANVKLLGISGGVSYGALGMTHHSAQDIAAFAATPGMRVYLPSDRWQTQKLIRSLMADDKPAYIRVGRNPVEDVYSGECCPFVMDKAVLVRDGSDAAIIACGEMVYHAVQASVLLEAKGIHAAVLDMFCVKPLDNQAVLDLARRVPLVLTVEEHSYFGGMGSMVSQLAVSACPGGSFRRVVNLALPDEPVIAGKSPEIFAHYKLDAAGIAETLGRLVKNG